MYEVRTPNAQPKPYTQLAKAKAFAAKKAKDLGTEVEVIDLETNTTAYVATYVEGRIFHPWERVENPAHQSPHFEGFYPAYQRKRISATVYRAYDNEVELKWRVWDGRTNNHQDVATTKAACALTKAMKDSTL